MILNLILGFALGLFIGIFSWRADALTRNGAFAATLTGGLIFGLGGLPWAALLLTFFISSSILSRAYSQKKVGLGEKFSKGTRRDWGQVLANGGLGATLAVVHELTADLNWAWIAYGGAMAAVNADTWATELGVLSRSLPRLIIDGRIVERGTSGGITPLGTLASLGGAGLIGLIGSPFNPQGSFPFLFAVITLSGFGGALFDSLLGATVQGIYRCPSCEKETERHPQHTCGEPTIHIRGQRWLNNDMVNLAASAFGATVAIIGWSLA